MRFFSSIWFVGSSTQILLSSIKLATKTICSLFPSPLFPPQFQPGTVSSITTLPSITLIRTAPTLSSKGSHSIRRNVWQWEVGFFVRGVHAEWDGQTRSASSSEWPNTYYSSQPGQQQSQMNSPPTLIKSGRGPRSKSDSSHSDPDTSCLPPSSPRPAQTLHRATKYAFAPPHGQNVGANISSWCQ